MQSKIRKLEADLRDSNDESDRIRRRADDAEIELKRTKRRTEEESKDYQKEIADLEDALKIAETNALNNSSTNTKGNDKNNNDDDDELLSEKENEERKKLYKKIKEQNRNFQTK